MYRINSYILFVLVLVLSTPCQSISGQSRKLSNKNLTTAATTRQNRNENTGSRTNKAYTVGKVIKIVDGDTYDLLIAGNQTLRIRMDGIDAPERGMPFYKVSKNYLGTLCFNKQVKFISTGKDNHDRYLGFSYLEDATELSHEMIKAGLAWHFKKYNSDKELADLEIRARNRKKGIWSETNPMSPWENRKLHRQGISTKKQVGLPNNK